MGAVRGGPDPGSVETSADLVRELDLLRVRAAAGSRKARVTLEDLAARVALPRSTVHAYVSGVTTAPADVLDRVVIALGASPAEQAAWSEAWFRVVRGSRKRTAVPRQLPPDVSAFTGRAEALAELDRLLGEAGRRAVVVSAIAGTAGVGKTALAVHWAHRVADRFPDGQLYLDLRGYDAPTSTADALAALLGDLGVSGADLPQTLAGRVSRYRTLLADRRALVVLDNANSPEQVRDLLPGNARCFVLITSRDALTGLVARDGARRVDLDLLTADEAAALLRGVLGDRVDAEPEAVRDLAELCARLPLALRIAAAHVLGGRRTIADHVTALRSGDRLTALEVPGDPGTAVRAAIDLSYRALDPAARRTFRLMGLMPGHDVTAPVVAALTDTADVGRTLRDLTAAHLVDEHVPGRYTFHDLLRLYAVEKCEDEEPARARVLEHYAARALEATQLVYPTPHRRVLGVPEPTFTDAAEANRWLADEFTTLVACARVADSPLTAARLCTALYPTLEQHRLMADWFGTARSVLATTRRHDHAIGQVYALTALGSAHWCVCEYDDALVHLTEARAVVDRAGLTDLLPFVLTHLGRAYISMGRLRDSATTYRHVLDATPPTDPSTSARLAILANVHWELGDLRVAYDLHEQAIQHAQSPSHELCARARAGLSAQALGFVDQAVEHYLTGLTLCHELDDPPERAGILSNLAGTYRDLGRHQDALRTARESLEISTRIGMLRTRTSGHHVLGSTHLLLGDHDTALTELHTSLDLATTASHPRGRGDALVSLAELHHALGDHDLARKLAREALDLSRGTGHKLIEGEAQRVLAEADHASGRDGLRSATAARDLHQRSGYALGLKRAEATLARLRG
ncbi:tetratricopeptide repeat protein [Umezawaea endophytica]|uniref:Tetratricopeptide repeat protein n=1 Tax=Umezawaea endophytica TaxID=1654476 RepID=A0A9X3A2N6_9PSEU|nr:helix-turn-helix domain-containing protein [Umezawaea endophytica]MCS7479263.1 tetratricopeptide repeat protein [Umezawaea endophytica]